MNYKEFKSEILTRARSASACEAQYKRAYEAKDFAALFAVIKDNFVYCCNNGIIDAPLLEQVREDADKCDVWLNVNASSGFLLAYDSATVKATGSATVKATGSATVKAYDSATVKAYDSATVKTYDSATVEAYDSATVEAYGSATVKAYDSATVKATDSATVEATGSATVKAYGSATVKAYGSAYINVRSDMECKISDNAIMRYRDTNEVITTSSMQHRTI